MAYLIFNNISFSYDNMQKPLIQKLQYTFFTVWTGIVGENGSGKTTLIKYIITAITGFSEKMVYMPHELSLKSKKKLLRKFQGLSNSEKGEVLSCFSRLGSDPIRLMQTGMPGPGEARKLLLALGMQQSPEVIFLDEPTNHLDVV